VKIDKDLVIAGALLHDIMKPYNYELDENDNIDHTDLFNLDHLTLCVAELYKRNYPLDLIKIIASHHGEHSPTRPGSIEAYIVHFADYIDSEINNVAIRVIRSRVKDTNLKEREIYDEFTPLVLYNIRSKEGKTLISAARFINITVSRITRDIIRLKPIRTSNIHIGRGIINIRTTATTAIAIP